MSYNESNRTTTTPDGRKITDLERAACSEVLTLFVSGNGWIWTWCGLDWLQPFLIMPDSLEAHRLVCRLGYRSAGYEVARGTRYVKTIYT